MIQKILAAALLLTAACSTPGSAPKSADAADASPADSGFPPLPHITTTATISEIKISHGLADQPPQTGEIVVDQRPDAGHKIVQKKTITTKKTETKTYP